jgi:hypothetical protein
VDEGLFQRVVVTTRGRRQAWVYVYPHPRPKYARGPLTRWDGPTVRFDLESQGAELLPPS